MRLVSLIGCLLPVTLMLCACSRQSEPVSDGSTRIQTEPGTVQGVAFQGVYAWKGIPYAKPPVDDLRWRAPQAVKAWKGVRSARDFGKACVQRDDISQSEDCLTLNIWRPAEAEKLLPVMIWIHGGALVHGSSSLYPGHDLAKQGVMVVSMNYRLGRLGFFAHPALTAEQRDDVHGNYGYLDQIAALQWVQRNIRAFGGDPGQVTLFGQSAGAGAVLVHLSSPLSRGLFHRAILQSPAMPGPRARFGRLAEFAEAEKSGLAYAQASGVDGTDAEALDVLRALRAPLLMRKASGAQVVNALVHEQWSVDVPAAIRDGKLVVESPEDALRLGHLAKVPVLAGTNDLDLGTGRARTKGELFALFGRDEAEARELYDPRREEEFNELKQRVFADRAMHEPVRYLARKASEAGLPVWVYRFSYAAASHPGPLKGAMHAAEIPYVFRLPSGNTDKDEDEKLADLISGYWTAFAKAGDPNRSGQPEWPRYDAPGDRIAEFIHTGFRAGPDPDRKRLDLWEKANAQLGQ